MFCFVMDCKMSCKWKKRQITTNSNVSFHRFPLDKELFTKWLEAIGVKHTSAISWQYNMYLCSNHFRKEDFEENLTNTSSQPPNIRKLKSSAIPSILRSTEAHLRSLSSKIGTNDKNKRNHLESTNYSTKQKMDMNQVRKDKDGESVQTFGANQDHSRVSVKYYKPRYLGDVCLSDMGNPERAKWCLMLAKEVLAKQTKHIKQLKKENRILYKKMDRLRKIVRIVKNTPENPSQSKETITLLVNI
ncbi:hypothetical protein WA026_007277 [Henosepilachna vigintioctopunctata]|uniref:THAP-type domain-containing protein n=1 Tax=Henosepilachna vigintioctopunctata TaxID=420089 RepID=A0AAW1UTQ3_9CUCU